MMPAAAEPALVLPPPHGLVRVGYHRGPFAWRAPRERVEDEDPGPLLAGNRFDAPHDEFFTLYFASRRYGAYLEKLAPFRPLPDMEARLDAAFDDVEVDAEHDHAPITGRLDADFLDPFVLAELALDPGVRFIDVEHPRTLDYLSQRVGRPFLDRFGLDRYDRGVPLNRDRRITRHLGLELHRLVLDNADIVGLRFSSVHDPAVDCWALWDKGAGAMTGQSLAPADMTDPEFRRAAATLRIELPEPPDLSLPHGHPASW